MTAPAWQWRRAPGTRFYACWCSDGQRQAAVMDDFGNLIFVEVRS